LITLAYSETFCFHGDKRRPSPTHRHHGDSGDP